MKKQFFYAALAIGMMSSCTSSDLPGNQAPENPEDEKVAIELGVSPLNAVVTTKGAGFAGNAAESEDAKWDKQKLNILMLKKIKAEDTKLYQAWDEIDNKYIFDGLEFTAPAIDDVTQETTANGYKGAIKNNLGAVRYYPLTGAYDFFGWHFDDATLNTQPTAWSATGESEGPNYTYNITIDGTQDIMIGKAELTSTDETNITTDLPTGLTEDQAKARAYSSWAARRNVQPIISFKHLLSRLDFVACLGKDLAPAEANITVTAKADGTAYTTAYTENDGYPQPNGEGKIDNGVYVKSISVLNPIHTFDVTVAAVTDANRKLSNPTPATNDDSSAFDLKQKPTGGNGTTPMEALKPVNAGYQENITGEKVGNGIMIYPEGGSFKMKVVLMQYVKVIDKNDATNTDPDGIPSSGDEIEDVYEWKESEMTTTVTLPSTVTSGSFEAGKYYTVKITIFGLQKIVVNAELTKWTEGGNVPTNPEDENFSN